MLMPSQLGSFEWIQVATPWQVEWLSQPDTVAAIHSIRVVSIHRDDIVTLDQICVKLPQLQCLRRLDMKKTEIKDLSPLASMTQLRELDLSSTAVEDITSLSSLTNLEVLTLDQTRVDDVSCIKTMPQLRKLTFWRWNIGPAVFSPLRNMRSLQELQLGNLMIKSLDDLLPAEGVLRKLVSNNIQTSGHTREARLQWASDFGNRLYSLESMDVRDAGDLIGPAVTNLGCLPRLRSIGHAVNCGSQLNQLLNASPMDLEDLQIGPDFRQTLQLPATDEYALLRRLPRLQSIKFHVRPKYDFFATPRIRETHRQRADLHAHALFDVLAHLPRVTRLEYAGYFGGHGSLAKLRHLEHLSLRDVVSKSKSFDWIVAFSSLRSLTIFNSTPGFDYSAISQLTQLEALDLDDCKLPSDDFAFISRLVNLQSLTLRGRVFDFGFLRGLKCLKSFAIDSFDQSRTKTKNVDVLGSLQRLRFVDISKTTITNVSALGRLPRLQSVAISLSADCTPLTEFSHPTLLRVVHGGHDCRWGPRIPCVQ